MTPMEELLAWGAQSGNTMVWAGILCFLRTAAFRPPV
jgi:hypothetical protein